MRANHPDAGRYDSAHPDDEPRGPVLTGATVEALDDEVDRLTAERNELAEVVRFLSTWRRPNALDWANGAVQNEFDRMQANAKAALAKLEE